MRKYLTPGRRFPDGIHIDGMAETGPASEPAAAEDDFFETWDKPVSKPGTPKPGTPKPSTPKPGSPAPPVIGRSVSANSAVTQSPAAPSAPRTVTSASLRANSSQSTAAKTTKLGAARLGSSTSSSASAPQTGTGAKKLGGLKAKKVTATIDFEEAERRAAEEEERYHLCVLDKWALGKTDV